MAVLSAGGGSLDLLEGTSSTPWSSAGYDDDILREFSSAAQDLDIGLLEPIVGWASLEQNPYC